MLLERLEDYGITGQIWSYFTIRDILHLLVTNKQIRKLCVKMNKLTPAEIDLYSPFGSKKEEKQREMFEKILLLFPNISKLVHCRSYGNYYSGECNSDIAKGKSLSVLYNSNLLRNNLKVLSISVQSYLGLLEIKNLKNITSLDISLSSFITNDSMHYILPLTSLNTLNLSWCFGINDVGLSYLTSLVNLTAVNISNCVRVTNNGLSHLAPLTKMTSLDISCLYISDLGLPHISKLKNLTTLSLIGCSNITDIGLFNLSYLCNLRELNLTYCYLTDDGLSFLFSLLNLESLSISWHELVTSNWLSQINNFTKLKYFRMDSIKGSLVKDCDLSQYVIDFLVNLESFRIAPIRGPSEVTKGLAHVEYLRKNLKKIK